MLGKFCLLTTKLRVLLAVMTVAAGLTTSADAFVTPRLKPPAPGLLYLSQGDHAKLSMITKAVSRKEYSFASATAQSIEDPIARSLGEWLYFYAEDPNVSIVEADRFLDLHQDWPAASRIQNHIEKKLDQDTPTKLILDFFQTREPRTGRGKLNLARALFANGDEAAGEIHLRDAWVNHTFPIKDEKQILSSYAGRLTSEDHIARVDHLLWKRQVTNARRVIPRLPAAERRKAEARAALLTGQASATRIFDSLSTEDRSDPGVMLAAVRYFRRKGEETRAVSIAQTAPTTPDALRNAERWWSERKLLVLWAIKERRYDEAYAMASGHGLEPGLNFFEAEFFAGWLALRYLNEPARAETHFKALAGVATAPISVARAYYWMGRAAEARGGATDAEAFYRMAAKHQYTFYGQLAAEELGGTALAAKFEEIPRATPKDASRFSSRPTVAALKMLSELENDQAFLVFAYHIDDKLESPGEFLKLAEITDRRGAPHITVRAGKVSVRKNAFAPEVSYPLVYVPEEATRFVPAEVILGLSRQESEFNPRAYSRAGARGMMQLIPSTAQLTAKKEGLPYKRSALLDDPVYNMTLGSAHLSHLFQKYNGSYVMTFAAYNAGPHRVTQWVERYGDPRSSAIDPVDWAESIPFSETRNYVQRVLENIQVYRARFNDAPIPGKLSRDLERGGKRGRVASLPPAAFNGYLAPLPARTLQFADAAVLTPAAPATPATPPSLATPTAGGIAVAASAPDAAATQDAPQTPTAPSLVADQEENIAPPSETSPAAPPESASKVAVSQPSTNVGSDTKAPETASAQTPPTEEPAQDTIVTTEAPSTETPAIVAAPAPAPAATTEPTRSAATQTPPISADDLNALQAGALADATSPSEEPAAAAPEAGTAPGTLDITGPIADAVADSNVATDSTATEIVECETYTGYIARTAKEEASASDLNAGMLAELESGGAAC